MPTTRSEETHVSATRSRRRLVAVAAAGVVAATLATAAPSPAAPTPAAVRPFPAPVSPAEALRVTEALAAEAPALPAGVAAVLAQRPASVPVAVDPAVVRAAASAEAGDDGGHEHPSGKNCEADAHHFDDDRNGDGVIQPWEANPNANESCEMIYAYDFPDDAGALEIKTEWVMGPENDPYEGLYAEEYGRTYTRTVARSIQRDLEPGGHHTHGSCDPTQDQWDTAMALAKRTKAELQKYVNNPHGLVLDGYYPYPVPATKTFHWFNSEYYGDHAEDGTQIILDETRPEMIMMAMTDDGFIPFNTAWVYIYEGDGDPFSVDANDPAQWPNGDNEGTGCLISWHGHTEGVEDEATFNTDGRTWMAHMWFYGGVYPFGDSDIDGAEKHGWWAPLNYVPAACNSSGGCI